MSENWFSYRARWRGTDYVATPDLHPDGLWVHLISDQLQDGFEEMAPGMHIRLVPAVECDLVAYVSMICRWRDEPFIVQDERPGELLLEYSGGKVPIALELGLERIERGVYRSWVPRHEVRGLRESTTMLVAPNN